MYFFLNTVSCRGDNFCTFIADTCEPKIVFFICLHVFTADIFFFFFLNFVAGASWGGFGHFRKEMRRNPTKSANKWETTKDRFCLYRPSKPREKTDCYEDPCGMWWTVNFDKQVLKKKRKKYSCDFLQTQPKSAFWHFGPRVKRRQLGQKIYAKK